MSNQTKAVDIFVIGGGINGGGIARDAAGRGYSVSLTESNETSNIHQETLRALKQVNTAFLMVACPMLSKSGDLLKSRLA